MGRAGEGQRRGWVWAAASGTLGTGVAGTGFACWSWSWSWSGGGQSGGGAGGGRSEPHRGVAGCPSGPAPALALEVRPWKLEDAGPCWRPPTWPLEGRGRFVGSAGVWLGPPDGSVVEEEGEPLLELLSHHLLRGQLLCPSEPGDQGGSRHQAGQGHRLACFWGLAPRDQREHSHTWKTERWCF